MQTHLCMSFLWYQLKHYNINLDTKEAKNRSVLLPNKFRPYLVLKMHQGKIYYARQQWNSLVLDSFFTFFKLFSLKSSRITA